MPFVFGSSRKPGAVLGAALGRFLGGETPLVALNRLHSIALYTFEHRHGHTDEDGDEPTRNDPLKTPTPCGEADDGELKLLREFPFFATLKCIESVSLYDPQTGTFLRDVLFLLSVKQEVSLIAFTSEQLQNGECVIDTVTLYHGDVDGCLYQYAPDEVHLIASTPAPRDHQATVLLARSCASKANGGSAPSSRLSLFNPYVTFAISRGEIFTLDVLTALGLHSQHGAVSAEDQAVSQLVSHCCGTAPLSPAASLFPPSLWQLADERAKAGAPVFKCALHSSEYEVRDISFLSLTSHLLGTRPSTDGGHHVPRHISAQAALGSSNNLSTTAAGPTALLSSATQDTALTLLVLFADIHGRTHVSTYALNCALPSATAKAQPTTHIGRPSEQSSPARDAPFRYLEGLLDGYDKRLARTGLLVSNCDPTAANVLPVGNFTLLVGSLLVTAIPHTQRIFGSGGIGGGGGPSTSGAGLAPGGAAAGRFASPMTSELPQGLEFACACPSFGVGGGARSLLSDEDPERTPLDAYIFFKDGTIVGVTARLDGDDGEAPLVRPCGVTLDTIPSDAVLVSHHQCLVTSRFCDSVLVDLDEDKTSTTPSVVVRNTGPVLDMIMTRDPASCLTAVAATGVGKNGGVSFIRSAATVQEYSSCVLWPLQATRIIHVGRLVILTSEYGSRFFCLEEDYSQQSGTQGNAHENRHNALSAQLTSSQNRPGGAPPIPQTFRVTRDVLFDAVLSDAVIVMGGQLSSVGAEGGHTAGLQRYYLIDRCGAIHFVTLLRRKGEGPWALVRSTTLNQARTDSDSVHSSLTKGNEEVGRWQSTHTVPGLASVLFSAQVDLTACQGPVSSPKSTLQDAELLVFTDAHTIKCFVSDGEAPFVFPTPMVFETMLDSPIACLCVTAIAGHSHTAPPRKPLVSEKERAASVSTSGAPHGLVVMLVGDWSGILHVLVFTVLPSAAHSKLPTLSLRNRECVAMADVPKSAVVVALDGGKVVACHATKGNTFSPGHQSTAAPAFTAFVGLVDGCCQQVHLTPLLQATADGDGASGTRRQEGRGSPNESLVETSRPVLLMRQPVECSAVGSKNMLLCRGASPVVLLLTPQLNVAGVAHPWRVSIQLAGLTLADLIDYCPCQSNSPATDQPSPSVSLLGQGGQLDSGCMLFLSNHNGCHVLTVGSLPEMTERTSHTFRKLGCTVTHVRHVSQWGKYALALRHADTDVIAFLPTNTQDPEWSTPLLPSNSFSLLENERAVFIEPLYLGGGNHQCRDGVAATREETVSDGHTDSSTGDFVVLVGSTFAFPDEQRPRSSRITWYRKSNDNSPKERASKDIGGQLQCCSVVPHYQGRIALGVSGCVFIFAWNAEEKTFVSEERLRIGLMVTKLIPIFETSDANSRSNEEESPYSQLTHLETAAESNGDAATAAASVSRLVALDARYGALCISVDRVQGGIKITARDKKLRGIMDGALICPGVDHVVSLEEGTDGSARDGEQDLCFCDESMNFFAMRTGAGDSTAAASAASRPSGGVPAQAAGAPSSLPPPPSHPGLIRLRPHAAAHIGDLVTAMTRGTLAPATLRSDIVPSPQQLLPGLGQDQLLCGTSHGAFIIISPVARPTFVFLKCLEMAVLAVRGALLRTGGFAHEAFRTVCEVGQPRSLNRTATFPSVSESLERLGDGRAMRESDNSDVCSADIVELYATMSVPEERRAVLRLSGALATAAFTAAAASDGVGGVPAPPPLSKMTKRELAQLLSDDERRERCNAILRKEGLPTVPLKHENVEAFVFCLQRTH